MSCPDTLAAPLTDGTLGRLATLVAAVALACPACRDAPAEHPCEVGSVDARGGSCPVDPPPSWPDGVTSGQDHGAWSDPEHERLADQDQCAPGEFIRCEGRETAVVCGEDGSFPGEGVSCDAIRPVCLESRGGCSTRFCDPGTFCLGDEVHLCSEDGRGASLVETCSNGCAQGACREACLRAEGESSYLGCSFIATWMDQSTLVPRESRAMAVSLANASAVPVQAEVLDSRGRRVASLTVDPGDAVRVPIPLPARIGGSSRISRSTWRINASGPLTVHQFNPPDNQGQFSNDASLLLPEHALGTDHIVLGWPTHAQPSERPGLADRAQVAIAALEPTEVTVRATVPLEGWPGTPEVLPGADRTFSLGSGEVLYLQTAEAFGAEVLDISGTRITTTRPVAVFSGHQCAFVPRETAFCDHLEQQLPPVSTWGSTHVLGMFQPRGQEVTVYRVLAAEPDVRIQVTPHIPAIQDQLLQPGEAVEFAYNGNLLLTASGPVAVGQFMVGGNYRCARDAAGELHNCAIPRTCDLEEGLGDPSFVLSFPTDQHLDDYVFLVPDQYAENYITVTAEERVRVTLDGGSFSVGGAMMWADRRAVSPGVHRIRGDGPFGLQVYGYDCAVSYAYPGGMGLRPGSAR